MSSVLVDQVLRGLWVGASTGMVRYGRAGNGYGMVLQDMGMGWYGLVCGTVFFGTVWYGRVPVLSGMWYGNFVWYWDGVVRYGLTYKECRQTDRQICLYQNRDSVLQTENFFRRPYLRNQASKQTDVVVLQS